MTHLNPHLIQIGLFDLGMVITFCYTTCCYRPCLALYIVYITWLYLVDIEQQRPHLLSLFMPFLYSQFLYIILISREITLIKEHNDEPSYGTLPVMGCQISHDPVVAPTGSTQFHDVPRCSTAPGLRLRIFGRSLKEVQEQLLLLSLAGQRHDGTG